MCAPTTRANKLDVHLAPQDTVCICATQLSQQVALKAMEVGKPYLANMLGQLEGE